MNQFYSDWLDYDPMERHPRKVKCMVCLFEWYTTKPKGENPACGNGHLKKNVIDVKEKGE